MDLLKLYRTKDESKSKEITEALLLWSRDYFKHRVNSRWIDERRCIPPHIVMDFARKGLMGFHVEERFSGLELSSKDWIRLIGQLGSLDATVSQLVAINALAVRTVMSYGSEELKETHLSELAKGRLLAAFAQTEAGAGTNFTKLKTHAIHNPQSDSWTISGEKLWIGNAGWSGMIVLICQAFDSNKKHIGLNAFLIPTDSAGLQIGTELNTMGLRGVVQNKLHFDKVEVSSDMLIGKVGKGLNVAVDAMSFTRLVISAQQIGLMKRAILIMHSFMKRREISTGLLIDNPVAINILSECIARVVLIEKLLTKIAEELDQGHKIFMAISALSKIISTEFAGYVTDKALQFLGGRGYEENNIIPQLVRDTRVTRIFEGPSEALLGFVGSRIKFDSSRRVFSSLFNSRTVEIVRTQVHEEITKLKSAPLGNHLNNIQHKKWLDYKVGLISSWAVLKLIQLDEDIEPEIAQWLDSGYHDMPKFVKGDCFLTSASIAKYIEGFKSDIGEVDQVTPALNWEIDPLIQAEQKQECPEFSVVG